MENFGKNNFNFWLGMSEYATNLKKLTVPKSAQKVQYVVKCAHDVPKIVTLY